MIQSSSCLAWAAGLHAASAWLSFFRPTDDIEYEVFLGVSWEFPISVSLFFQYFFFICLTGFKLLGCMSSFTFNVKANENVLMKMLLNSKHTSMKQARMKKGGCVISIKKPEEAFCGAVLPMCIESQWLEMQPQRNRDTKGRFGGLLHWSASV